MTDTPGDQPSERSLDAMIASLDPAPANGPRMGYSTVGSYFATKAACRSIAAERERATDGEGGLGVD